LSFRYCILRSDGRDVQTRIFAAELFVREKTGKQLSINGKIFNKLWHNLKKE